MRIIQPSFEFLDEVNGEEFLQKLERCGRVCYKSEAKITPESSKKFVRELLEKGHFSVIEHVSISVLIICDRGVTHEWVRHRIASYSQESTRYCNYKSSGITVITPFFFNNDNKYKIWLEAMDNCEKAYMALIELGSTPQEARTVLPNSLKTEIVVTFNLREWLHFFYLRTAKSAHPQMREIAVPLLKEFQKRIPVLFDSFVVDEKTCSAKTDLKV